jgi:hypothetical protein
LAEAIRWQVCEGELLQIIGRGRGVNRTAANPLAVLVLTDIPLPLPVDELVAWDVLAPSPADLMLSTGGVALESAADAARAYPDLWPSAEAAKKAFQRTSAGHSPIRELPKGECPALLRTTYQRVGQRIRPASAWIDVAAEPDPRAWLIERLGALAACDAPEPSSEARRVPRPSAPSTSAPSKPDPWDVATSAAPPVLHPPLPGEDLQQHRPPPAQAGLLAVIPGRHAVQTDPYPEPGSYEPDEEDLLPLELGTPLPAQAPGAWQADLRRRLAALPPPALRNDPISDFFIWEKYEAREAEVKAAWSVEWKAAWIAGRRLPPMEEGTI